MAFVDADFLFEEFIKSRRQGISPQSIRFYRICLKPFMSSYPLTSQGINAFLSSRKCGNAKHAYYRAIRALCNWATKEGYLQDSPISKVDVPNVEKRILPSLTPEQVDFLIEQAETLRDKAMVSLFADSGMRLSELASIRPSQIDWDNKLIIIWGKGGKQRKAPFTNRTARLLREYVEQNGYGDNIWHLNTWGIVSVSWPWSNRCSTLSGNYIHCVQCPNEPQTEAGGHVRAPDRQFANRGTNEQAGENR